MDVINHGVTSAYKVRPLLVDATGAGIVFARNYGYFNSDWRKAPPAFGPSSVLYHSQDNTNLAAGANNLDFPTVPTNQVWVYTNIYIQYVGTPPTNISAVIQSGGSQYLLYRQLAPVTAVGYDRQGYWVIFPGWFLRMTVAGATAGDDAFFRATGFVMDLSV